MSFPPVHAVCLDLDGTLLDSERFYYEITHEWLHRHFGVTFTEDEFVYYELILDDKLIDHLLESGRLSGDVAGDAPAIRSEILTACFKQFDRLISGASAQASAKSLHDFHRRVDLPLALTTCSKSRYVEPFLTTYGLDDVFSLVLTREDVTRLKPDPEIYLKALEHFGLTGREVVALEDAPRGITAALSAGMTVIRPLAYLLGHERMVGAIEVPDLDHALDLTLQSLLSS
jgi:putative hydrolase of the HAD superfamily